MLKCVARGRIEKAGDWEGRSPASYGRRSPFGSRYYGYCTGVQSTAGGTACPNVVSSDGEFLKSNMSSKASAYWSLRVRCCAGFTQRVGS
jgi:hypothetical protein